MRKLLTIISAASLFSSLFITTALNAAPKATNELDRDFVRSNIERVREKLPKTLVMRVDQNGQVSVAHLNEKLPAKASEKIAKLQFAAVDADKTYKQTEFMELDSDGEAARESWYYWYNYSYSAPTYYYRPAHYYHQPVYYAPVYYYANVAYNYYNYFAYNYGGFFYYYFGW